MKTPHTLHTHNTQYTYCTLSSALEKYQCQLITPHSLDLFCTVLKNSTTPSGHSSLCLCMDVCIGVVKMSEVRITVDGITTRITTRTTEIQIHAHHIPSTKSIQSHIHTNTHTRIHVLLPEEGVHGHGETQRHRTGYDAREGCVEELDLQDTLLCIVVE